MSTFKWDSPLITDCLQMNKSLTTGVIPFMSLSCSNFWEGIVLVFTLHLAHHDECSCCSPQSTSLTSHVLGMLCMHGPRLRVVKILYFCCCWCVSTIVNFFMVGKRGLYQVICFYCILLRLSLYGSILGSHRLDIYLIVLSLIVRQSPLLWLMGFFLHSCPCYLCPFYKIWSVVCHSNWWNYYPR